MISTTKEYNKPNNITGIDTMAIELLKSCTVTDEKASIKVGGHTYSSITEQKGEYSIVAIRKDKVLLCMSIYRDDSGYHDHY